MRPVMSQLPLFVISFLLTSANTIYTGLKYSQSLFHGVWDENMTRVIVYLSISLAIAYIIALIGHVARIRWVKITLYAFVLVLFGILCFVQLNFHSNITPTIIMAIAATNVSEAKEFFQQFAFSWQSLVTYAIIAITILLIVILERHHSKLIKLNGTRRIPLLILVVLFVCLLWGAINMRHYYKIANANFLSELETSQTFSHGAIAMDNVTDWLYCLKALKSSQNEINRSITNTQTALLQPITTDADSLIVILIIGESYIKNHASIYGYNLNTTPHLQELQQKGNLAVFTNCISPFNTTDISLKNTLSTNSIGKGEEWFNTTYWPSLIAKAGFAVTMWDNQHSFSPLAGGGSLDALIYNKNIANTTYLDRNKEAFSYDGELINDYFKHIAKSDLDSTPLRLAIFHLMGQHVAPSMRYPKQFDIFKGDNHAYSKWPEYQAQYRAEYDNATLYNDFVIYSLIRQYADKCAVMVYFSDHGEEAYDFRNSFGRQNDLVKTKEILHYQNDVPLVVWYSDTYAGNYPDVVQRIQQATARPMMLDILGYMIFDLARINSSIYRSNLNILSNDYKCPPRITYSDVNYDEVCK